MSHVIHPPKGIRPSYILNIGIMLGPQFASQLSTSGLGDEVAARQRAAVVKEARNALRYLVPGPKVQFFEMFPADRDVTVLVVFREGADVSAEDREAFCDYCREVVTFTAEEAAREATHRAG